MKDERIIDLVNGELDGTNSPDEQAELTTAAEEDPSVRQMLHDMEKLNRLLSNVPMVEPPASLKPSIMNTIARREEAVKPSTSTSWIERVLAPFVRRPAWAVTYAFSIGIVVGLGVFTVVESTGPDTNMVKGTITNADPMELGAFNLDATSAFAEVVVKKHDRELRVDLSVKATGTAILRIASEHGEPIVIETSGPSPEYSLLIAKTGSITVDLITDEATDSRSLAISSVNE